MPRLSPVSREALAEFEDHFKQMEQLAGYVPNSLLTMGRRPELLRAFFAFSSQLMAPGKLEPELRSLVGFVASTAAGCRYCQAHTSSTAGKMGVAPEKLRAAFEFDWSPVFSERERAALRLAAAAGSAPPTVDDGHFDDLRRHFSEDEILEMVSVIAFFGFMNRWNDTLGTALEAGPLEFARAQLSEAGWEPGSHV